MEIKTLVVVDGKKTSDSCAKIIKSFLAPIECPSVEVSNINQNSKPLKAIFLFVYQVLEIKKRCHVAY
jgi:hypothetical protein